MLFNDYEVLPPLAACCIRKLQLHQILTDHVHFER